MTATSRRLLYRLPLLLTIAAITTAPISSTASTDTATSAATTTCFYIILQPITIVDPATTATAMSTSIATTRL